MHATANEKAWILVSEWTCQSLKGVETWDRTGPDAPITSTFVSNCMVNSLVCNDPSDAKAFLMSINWRVALSWVAFSQRDIQCTIQCIIIDLSYIGDPHFVSFSPWFNFILTIQFYYLTGLVCLCLWISFFRLCFSDRASNYHEFQWPKAFKLR